MFWSLIRENVIHQRDNANNISVCFSIHDTPPFWCLQPQSKLFLIVILLGVKFDIVSQNRSDTTVNVRRIYFLISECHASREWRLRQQSIFPLMVVPLPCCFSRSSAQFLTTNPTSCFWIYLMLLHRLFLVWKRNVVIQTVFLAFVYSCAFNCGH